jgi:all-trans-8'-apo-beta-carotenal 15,15'-oxygenase
MPDDATGAGSAHDTYRAACRSLQREHGYEPLVVEGTIPEALRGTLMRAGPALFERHGVPYSHPFEADGGITSVRFGDGGVEGACRVLDTEARRQEAAAGRPLYSSGARWLDKLVGGLKGQVKNTANTNLMHWQERLFALMEACPPTEVDPELLTAIGEQRFDGLIRGAFSAHPHHVPARATTYNLGLEYGRKNFLHLYAFPDEGAARRVAKVPLPYATMVHDFAVTPRHAIFLVSPACLQSLRAILQIGRFSDFFRWEPSRGSRVLVVPLDSPDDVTTIELDAFWVWHFGNAYERGDEIIVDMCRYPDFTSLDAIGGDEHVVPAAYHRATVSVATGKMQTEVVDDAMSEFPVTHPAVRGLQHKHTWLVRDGGVGRLDHDTGRVDLHRFGTDQLATEPIFAPLDGGREDEGWVLSLVYDAPEDRSYVAVLDAANMSAEPIARAWFDHRVPLTFHGLFLPA